MSPAVIAILQGIDRCRRRRWRSSSPNVRNGRSQESQESQEIPGERGAGGASPKIRKVLSRSRSGETPRGETSRKIQVPQRGERSRSQRSRKVKRKTRTTRKTRKTRKKTQLKGRKAVLTITMNCFTSSCALTERKQRKFWMIYLKRCFEDWPFFWRLMISNWNPRL